MAVRERISILASKHVKLKDSVKIFFGDGSAAPNGDVGDISMAWDGTDFDILQAGTNSAINVGVDGAGMDLKLYGDTASAHLLWDQSDDALEVVGDARLDFSGATVKAANTDGGLIKAGTSAARIVEDTADMRFINVNVDNGATSGDNRALYLRLYLTGAGGGGEAARIFTTVENVAAGTAHGAHISLNWGASGSITGLGVASRNTLHLPDAAMTGGTYAATQAEIYSDGSSTAPAGVTELSALRVVLGGNATGIAAVDDKAFLFTIDGGSINSGNICQTTSATDASHAIRVKVNGTTMYLLANTSI